MILDDTDLDGADPGEDLVALRERVKRAQAGDRELDGRLLCGLFGHRFLAFDADGLAYERLDELGLVRVPADEVARLTGSLDAAAALVSLILPDWTLVATIRPDHSAAELVEDPPPFRRSKVRRTGPGPDGAARAALVALIDVLESALDDTTA